MTGPRCGRGAVAGLLATVAVLAGCSGPSTPSGPGQVIAPAGPSVAPETTPPAGQVVPVAGRVVDSAALPEQRVLGVLTTDPSSVVLLDLDRPAAAPRTVALPGPATRIVPAATELLVPVDGAVIRIDPAAATSVALPVVGDLRSVAVLPDGRLGVGTATGEVRVLAADGGTAQSVTGLAGADDLVVVGDDLLALDRAQSALVGVDLGAGTLGAALRAGEGAARATTNGADRVVVTDPARGELLIYSAGPVLLRQRYPVPGGPWAVAVDPENDRAWVTLTATNELVSFDLAGPEPVEQRRLPTVTRPDSVAVDPSTGTVYVGSGDGQLQVITPTTAPPA